MLLLLAAATANSGWGCCADHDAAGDCGKCRWWARGAFCEAHAVNCHKCGQSLYCPKPTPPAPPSPPPSAPVDLRADGGRLVSADGSEFLVKGISWYGMEENYALFQGLEKASLGFFLDFLRDQNFNALRVPLSVTNILDDKAPWMINPDLNVELYGLKQLAILDRIVSEAAKRNILVLLDMHRLKAGDTDQKLWHSEAVTEEQLLRAWRILADRLCGAWNVMGADAFNEPNSASWGVGGPTVDWAAAAEKIGDAILSACPRWLILVQGVGDVALDGETAAAPGQSELEHNWGGNLEGVRARPIRLSRPEKLVYSPHVYGPSVADHDFFHAKNFTAAMPRIWDQHFGFVSSAPIVVGEWGGWYDEWKRGRDSSDVEWQQAFARYLRTRRIGSFYWSLNPTSGDTGGILRNDWRSPQLKKLELLASLEATPVRQSPAGGGGRAAAAKACTSSHDPGPDSPVATCSKWCTAAQAEFHCSWCYCRACDFC